MAVGALIVSFLACILLAQANSHYFKQALDVSQTLEPRVLKPATPLKELAKRSLDRAFTKEVSLHYVEDADPNYTPMVAHVALEGTFPTLIIEEIEDLLEDVSCTPTSIKLRIRPGSYGKVYGLLRGHDNFYAITSHDTCNEHSSRKAYRAAVFQFYPSTSTIDLMASPVDWRDVYHLKVDYGMEDGQFVFNDHYRFKRRALEATQTDSTTLILEPTLSSPDTTTVTTLTPPAVTFPVPTSTAGSNRTIGTTNIDKSFKDQQILPLPDNALVQGLALAGVGLPDLKGMVLTCVECSVGGSMSLTSGSFSTSRRRSKKKRQDLIDVINDIEDFIDEGFISLSANDLKATVNLGVSWAKDNALAGITIPIILATIPLSPFSIPSLAVIGPIFRPRLILTATVSADINISYGFTMTVPNNSSATASIGQLNKSSIAGFDDTNFSPLPFNANLANPSLNFSVTLQHEILAGINFVGDTATAGAGVFLNLPTMALSIQAVSGTDEKCNPSSNSSLVDNISSHFGPLINIVPEVQVAAGFIAQAEFDVPGFNLTNQLQTAYTPLAYTATLSTTCLAFAKPTGTSGSDGSVGPGTFVTAAAALASETSKSAAVRFDVGCRSGLAWMISLVLGVMMW